MIKTIQPLTRTSRLYITLLPFLILFSSCTAKKGFGKDYLLVVLILLSPVLLSVLIVLIKMELNRSKKLKKTKQGFSLQRHKTLLLLCGITISTVLLVNTLPLEREKNNIEGFIQDIHAMDHNSAVRNYKETFLGKNNINELMELSYQFYNTESLPDWNDLPFDIAFMERKSTDEYKNNRLACVWLMSKNTYYFYKIIDSLPSQNYGSTFIKGIDQVQNKHYNEAIMFFETSIVKKEFVAGATQELSILLYRLNRTDELGKLINDQSLINHIPTSIKREYYYKNSLHFNYYKSILNSHLQKVNIFGFIGAFLIIICWLVFLKSLNPFYSESITFTVIAFTLSCLMAFSSNLVYDYIRYSLNFSGEDNIFIYCFGVIGPIEEIVKFIPFLIVLTFSKDFKEPFSYLYYASICALGFSFVENFAVYLSSDNISIIQGRGLIATFGHIFDLSLVGYVMMVGKNKRSPFISALIGLLLAIISHGLYDFIIFKELHPFVFYILFFIMVQVWSDLANNALNISKTFEWNSLEKYSNNKLFFTLSLLAIILTEYILLAVQMGPEVANDALAGNIFLGFFLVMYMGLSLTNFDFFNGYLAKIKPPYQIKDILFPKIVNTENFVGSNIKVTKNKASNIFPIEGYIYSRHIIKSNTDYYLVKTDKVISKKDLYHSNYFLIHFNEFNASIKDFKKCSVDCFLITRKTNLREIKIDKTSLKQISTNSHLSELQI